MKQDRKEVCAWAAGLGALHARVGRHFRRPEPRQRVKSYVQALLSGVDRKNGWQIAEHVGESTPYGIQRLIASARWDADAVRDEVRAYALEHLADEDAVLVLDETGFLKKGTKSAGVARQYSGTAGKIENCQIGVFLAYTSSRGTALIDRALYLPKEWTGDAQRRREAGIPEAVSFQTKPQQARVMLERAFEAGIEAAWVVADEVYGRDRRLRMYLESQAQPFVLAVAKNEVLWYGGIQQVAAKKIAAGLEEGAWQRLSAGEGEKGPRLYRLGPGAALPDGRARVGALAAGAAQPGGSDRAGLLRRLRPGRHFAGRTRPRRRPTVDDRDRLRGCQARGRAG